jgi:hypothetical protein
VFSQTLVEAADGTGRRGNTHQFFRHFPHLMGAGAAHKHLCQRFCDLRFVAIVAFEDLGVKLPFSISGHFEIFDASSRSDEIACVGAIAIATSGGGAFSRALRRGIAPVLRAWFVRATPGWRSPPGDANADESPPVLT